MPAYLDLAVLAATGAAGVGVVLALARWVQVARPVHDLPAFSGGRGPAEHALSRYHARWYPVTLLFLAFDVEMLYMYPWTVVVSRVGAGAVVEMFVFLGVLMAAVVWAWREGALRWT
ncbi:NADH-quinone oxidoreductase subunit A [Klenkia sp. PcliD-1-E]|uniref:NADH-quinone oxidoreductase subunit A n=1 Tax=Klenkia sp. PcliD-1-E TaxID=2954492 RepID=UPI0020970EA7|nr:NADH-quinone oxidoreductase subunit A [Klenkia sp. PcliD-1-E]MCO7222333.1 NADH-quinone oxidoreductase subunit A [Klenkia sp. PcliD-1-E]